MFSRFDFQSLIKSNNTPIFARDILTGFDPRNKAAKEIAAQSSGESPATVAGPADALLALHKSAATKLFEDAVVFFQNPQPLWEQIDIVRASGTSAMCSRLAARCWS